MKVQRVRVIEAATGETQKIEARTSQKWQKLGKDLAAKIEESGLRSSSDSAGKRR